MKNRMNHDNQFELDYEDMEAANTEYDNYEYDDYGNDAHGKQKSMKSLKNENKPKWRSDRKKQKKFKHDVLGID